MAVTEETLQRLAGIPNLHITRNVRLSQYTRFGIGGPADVLAETGDSEAFIVALTIARQSGEPYVVIGGGSNLVAADEGFRGIVLRYGAHSITITDDSVAADGGAVLQDLVDETIAAGLAGIHTMTGIPGWVGAAVYGNAGAYGHSISEWTRRVRFFDGDTIREFDHAACEFHYRESVFKKHKDWIVLSVELHLQRSDATELKFKADAIRKIRDEKYPPDMKCAGSIFKNYLFAELPGEVAAKVPAVVVREGKVPSAYFLEQVGAKGLRVGDIQVANYHANLIYNAGLGTAKDLKFVIDELKRRIQDRFAMPLEEEVQYVGCV